jgi:hypothetical protein
MISEEELRLALSPHRVDPAEFESAVRVRLSDGSRRARDPLVTMPPLLRSAASLLPLDLLTSGQLTRNAAESAPIAGAASKLLGYAAFPAISMFVLLGSAIFGVATVRGIQSRSSARPMDEHELRAATTRWWPSQWWGGSLIPLATLAAAWFGATWLLFLGYIVSTLLLLYVLKSFAKIGIGSRLVVGQSCMVGLALLSQTGIFSGIGDRDIHFVDQALLTPVFFVGEVAVALVSAGITRQRSRVLSLVPVLLLSIWVMNPILWPATTAGMRAYVESFDHAEFSSASWGQWERVASFVVTSKLDPDLSRPRRLAAEEIADHNKPELPNILNSALRLGLVRADQIDQLGNYKARLGSLLDAPASLRIALGFDDWVIRAAVLRNELTPEQRDHLAQRLHATMRWSLTREQFRTLQDPLRATQLLEVVGRPVDPTQYRSEVHALLKRLQHGIGGSFRRAGGFMVFENLDAGDLDATSDAVELMEVYGVPEGLDLNWERSFLRPGFLQFSSQKWIAAAARDRLNRLPGATRPSWVDILYYERSFLAAVILVGLCLYATAISPKTTLLSTP